MKKILLLFIIVLITGCKPQGCGCGCYDCGIKCVGYCENNRCYLGEKCCENCKCEK